MTLLFAEGYEGFNTPSGSGLETEFKLKHSNTNFSSTISLGAGSFGEGNSMLAGGTGAQYFAYSFSSQSSLIVGRAVKFRHGVYPTGSTGHPLFFLRSSATNQLVVRCLPSGFLRVYRNTTLLGTSSDRLWPNRWYSVELHANIGNSGSYELRINGRVILGNPSVDTDQANNGIVDNVLFDWDDIGHPKTRMMADNEYILIPSGTYNNSYLGDIKIIGIYPDGDDSTDFTPAGAGDNYSEVDELVADGDTSYVESGTNGHRDLYSYEDVADLDNICAVIVNTIAKQTSSEELITVIDSGGTVSGNSAQSVSGSYATYSRIIEENPDTTAAFTPAEVNALKAGVEVSV